MQQNISTTIFQISKYAHRTFASTNENIEVKQFVQNKEIKKMIILKDHIIAPRIERIPKPPKKDFEQPLVIYEKYGVIDDSSMMNDIESINYEYYLADKDLTRFSFGSCHTVLTCRVVSHHFRYIIL